MTFEGQDRNDLEAAIELRRREALRPSSGLVPTHWGGAKRSSP
jgi:hypothetical protein